CQRIKNYQIESAKIWFLEGGINDLPHTPTDSIIENYRCMIAHVRESGATPVIHLTLYTRPNIKCKKTNLPHLRDSIDVLNRKLRVLADAENLEIIDLNPLLAKDKVLEEKYTRDGLHLTHDAYLLWAAEIDKILQNKGL